MKQAIKVRFAPSPTGPLHIGGARSALFNYLFARKQNGVFVLRVEDTDTKRSEEVYYEDIIKGLNWLGLNPDETYRQSERADIYKAHADQLTTAGLTYEQDGGLYLRIPTDDQKIVVHDLIRGDVEFNSKDFDDIVLLKKDGNATFHFANVVDDITMGITHVIRGEDHLSNTPKHIMIYQALGAEVPTFAHMPLILNEDRSKMSKRSGDTSLTEYINKGYIQPALINFLVQLGWSDKDGQEIFNLDELVDKFALERVQKGGAVFNLKHLNYLNHHYLSRLPFTEYQELAHPFVKQFEGNKTLLESALKLTQDRAQYFDQLPELISFFFDLPDYEASMLVFKKSSPDQTQKGLQAGYSVLKEINHQDWNQDKLQQILDHTLDAEALNPGDLFWPIRVALSGLMGSPSPVEILEALGKEESLSRLELALAKIGN
ncbi:MAG: glutamate--tRNA ligase [Patescibacteria group bacterium]